MWVRDRPSSSAGRVPEAPLTREHPNEKETDMAKDRCPCCGHYCTEDDEVCECADDD